MVKQKISVTVDGDMLDLVAHVVDGGRFRNRSHVFEFALRKFMEVDDGRS